MTYPQNGRFLSLLILLYCGLGIILTTSSSARAQDEPTATPNAEGIIYAQVQANDSLWSMAARAGISLAELLALNNLTEEAIIQPGQLLITGRSTPPPTATVATLTPTATATLPPPTPTLPPPPPPRTAICLKAFIDMNKNGIHDPGEPFKTAVAFTIFNEQKVVGNYVTTGISEPYCLEGLAPGEYKITRSIGRDEVLTTTGDWTITLPQGNVLNLEFGSYTGSRATKTARSQPTPIAQATLDSPVAAPEAAEVATYVAAENGRFSTTTLIVIITLVLLAASVVFLFVRNQFMRR